MANLDVFSNLMTGSHARLPVPFIGKGNIWINNTYKTSCIDLARNLIYDAIIHTAPGQLSILGYDADLTGLFAPFASLSTGESKVLTLIRDAEDFSNQLRYLEQQITAVQNVIQGRADSLITFRHLLQRPVEGYKLVILAMDIGLISQDLFAKLSLLLRSGPACGISFLIVSTTYLTRQISNGRVVEIKISALSPNITVLEADRNQINAGDGTSCTFARVSAENIIDQCNRFMALLRTTEQETIPFFELHKDLPVWSENSTDGVTFTIGKYGTENMDIIIGDEINQRHNAIITGAVGQGKSNLISVLIHSICLRYSPDEVQLYLLDFKEGVTFKAFSNIGREEYLPHARVLGLESDMSFGKAVLNDLYGIYQSRMRIMKDRNVKSIREFRRRFPGEKMPRIIVIIDEFQMMFGDDIHTGQEIADKLEKSVRLFRAAGIHFILSSQTLIGNMALANKRDSLFSQVPIRIALKNSISESKQVLQPNNSAAAFLRPREAIVNLDYGEITQNRKTVVAYADEEVLLPLRRKLWERAKETTTPPYVFESERRITVSSSLEQIRLRRASGATPAAFLGDLISVWREKAAIPLPDEAGRNIAIFGASDADCDQASGMMQGIAVSLALQHADGSARFLFCDFRDDSDTYGTRYPAFSALMECAGHAVESIAAGSFEQAIKNLTEQKDCTQTIYVFGAAMDRWQYEKLGFGQGSVLKEFAEKAPAKHIHLIGWWVKASAFMAQNGLSADAYNTRIFLRLDERTVQTMSTPFIRWSSQSNRALLYDAVEFTEETILIPYAPVTTEDQDHICTIQ